MPPGQDREMVYCRAKDIVYMEDYHFPSMRSDGADIKIVQGYYYDNDVIWTEVHRVPSNAFQLQTTEILFPLENANISANKRAPTNRFHQLYWSNKSADPDNIKDDPDSVFQYYESFEAYDTASFLNGQGGWTTTEGSDDSAVVFDTHYKSSYGPNKVWGGDKFLYIKNDPRCARFIGGNVSDIELHVRIFTTLTGKAFVTIKDDAKYVKLGLDMTADSVYYDLNGAGNIISEPPIIANQIYDLKFLVWYDSGVSGYVDDVLVFDWADSIVQFDTLIIDGSSTTAFVDAITMTKYVLNSPSPALADGTDSIEAPRRRRLIPSYRGVR